MAGRATSTEPILIVGGGVGGLGVALALAHRGRPSVVIEARATPDDVDRGDVLHPGTLPLLARWSALSEIERRGPHRFEKFRIVDNAGELLFEANTAALMGHGYEFTSMRHPDIARSLEDAALRTGMVELRRRERCTALESRDGRIIGVRTTRRRYYSMLTVVATGGSSRVRDTYFGPPRLHRYGTVFYNTMVRCPDEFASAGYYVLGRAGLMVLVPLPQRMLRIGIQFTIAETRQLAVARDFRVQAESRLRTLAHVDLEEVAEGRLYVLQRAYVDAWTIPGAVLVGDASHQVHPAGGQGMNLALADAEALAASLDGVDSSDQASLDYALLAFQRRRKQQLRPTMNRTHLMGLAANVRHGVLTRGRSALIRAVNHVPFVKRAVFTAIMDVGDPAHRLEG